MNDKKQHPQNEDADKSVDELAKEQMTEDPETYHLPTDGKKPGEVEDFKKSLKNNEENKDELKNQK